jgi:type VI protein secretion system component Hcp
MKCRLIIAAFCLALTAVQHASASIYMKVDGIEGESTSKDYVDWIDVEDYVIGFAGASHSQPNLLGRLTKFDVAADVSKASPLILLSTLTGQHHSQLILAITKNTGAAKEQEYARWTFDDVLFTAFKQTAVGSPVTIPRDLYSIDAAQVKYQYTEFGPDGAPDGNVQMMFNLLGGGAPVVAIEGNVPNFVFATGGLAVPEPASVAMTLTALIGLASFRRRRL